MPKTAWLKGMGTITVDVLFAVAGLVSRIPHRPVRAFEKERAVERAAGGESTPEPSGVQRTASQDEEGRRVERRTLWLQRRQAELLQAREKMLSAVQEAAQGLERCAEAVGPNQPAQALLDEALDRLNRVARDLREEISPLGSLVLDGADLLEDLKRLVAGVEQASLMRVEARLSPSVRGHLPAAQAVHLLYVVREAFVNALRHSGATAIAIRAAVENRRLVISVADDGEGFDLGAVRRDHRQGLARMQLRAEAADALLQVESAPGAGTIVTVAVPFKKENGRDEPQLGSPIGS